MHRQIARLTKAAGVVATAGLVAMSITMAPAQAEHRANLGNTRVAVAPRVAGIVTGAGIAVKPTGGAKAFGFENTLALRFPISNTAGKGTRIKHTGGVQLSAGSASISLSRFSINLKTKTVSAKVNGDSRAKLFNVKASHRPKLGAVRLTFNMTAAGALNSTFGVHVFKAGQNFGFGTVNLTS